MARVNIINSPNRVTAIFAASIDGPKSNSAIFSMTIPIASFTLLNASLNISIDSEFPPILPLNNKNAATTAPITPIIIVKLESMPTIALPIFTNVPTGLSKTLPNFLNDPLILAVSS